MIDFEKYVPKKTQQHKGFRSRSVKVPPNDNKDNIEYVLQKLATDAEYGISNAYADENGKLLLNEYIIDMEMDLSYDNMYELLYNLFNVINKLPKSTEHTLNNKYNIDIKTALMSELVNIYDDLKKEIREEDMIKENMNINDLLSYGNISKAIIDYTIISGKRLDEQYRNIIDPLRDGLIKLVECIEQIQQIILQKG